MERLFNPGALYGMPGLADVTIKYSGKQLRAHKVILSMRSKYFERAFDKVGGFKESHEGVLELFDDSPQASESLIRYIYTSEYPYEHNSGVAWEKHLELAVVADKYGLDLLKEETLKRLERDPKSGRISHTINFVSRVGQEFPRQQGRIKKLVQKHCGSSFRVCFKRREFRDLLDNNTGVRDALYLRYMHRIVGLPDFASLLERDSKLASRYLGGLVKLHRGHMQNRDCRRCEAETDDESDDSDESEEGDESGDGDAQ